MDLIEILKQSEGKTLEFKRDLSSPNGLLKTLVAFANTAGGLLLVGIKDKTKSIFGIDNPLDEEERLTNIISHNIEPLLLPEIEILPWKKTYVIAVQVHLSQNCPHYLKKAGEDKGIYIRVGSSNRMAGPEIIAELKRVTRSQPFDMQPMVGLDSEAINFRVASEFFASVRPLRQADLISLHLQTKYQGRTVPTVAGILLFGKEREYYFPDAWIQAGRFKGNDKRDILDTLEIHDCLIRSIEKATEFVRKHSMVSADIGAVYRTDRWNIPQKAMREVIINAVVHADYSQSGAPIRISIFDNRVEIENPGLLPFGLTIEEIQCGTSKLRNRAMGRIFKELGLIEQWGSGIKRIKEECADMGLPDPLFEEIGTHFRVTLFTERITAPRLEEKGQAIIALLAKRDGLPTHEIAKEIRLSDRATRTRLITLIEKGLVAEICTNLRDPTKRYYLIRRD
ncbi:MAG: putative DNA binding domain-containing protein [Gammaproteobacteria bacterium]|nr:putative DNA binding domain-containing protein [Gammaproteobacteria bacterium]